MPKAVKCPSCKTQLQVSRKYLKAGGAYLCPHCSKKLVLKSPESSKNLNSSKRMTSYPEIKQKENVTVNNSRSLYCPKCSEIFLVDKKQSGSKIRCPNLNCSVALTVPILSLFEKKHDRENLPVKAMIDNSVKEHAEKLLNQIELLKVGPLLPPWFAQAGFFNAWVNNSDLMSTLNNLPGYNENQRGKRKCMLDRWYQGGFPAGTFPAGAFEELQLQHKEALSRLFFHGDELRNVLESSQYSDTTLERCLSTCLFLWKKQKELHESLKLAIRQMKNNPPPHFPYTRLVFTEDDVRIVPDSQVPETGSPERHGFHVV